MISTVKQSAFTINGCDFIRSKSQSLTSSRRFSLLPPLPAMKSRRSSGVSVSKPVYVSSVESFGGLKRSNENSALVKCKAYEADRAEPIEGPESKTELARRMKIGVYFATWWFLNVIFNIYNKKVLNAFPFPWLTSTLSLAAGSLIMLISWALRIAETPKTDLEFWKTLFPVRKIEFLGYPIG